MKRLGSVVVLSLLAATAHANGRDPAGISIHFKQGDETHVIAGLTYGLILSDDHGASWHWMCEAAVGYGGTYDPVYVYTPQGTIFATTYDGLRVMHDGYCEFKTTWLGSRVVSRIAMDSAGRLLAASSDPNDAAIYQSTTDGAIFTPLSRPGKKGDWWSGLEIAPSNPQRVYLSGYRIDQTKTFLMFRSDDGGEHFTALPVTDIAATSDSAIELAAVSPTNPDLLFARVTFAHSIKGDAVYRSADAGQTWTMVYDPHDTTNALVVRANGEIVIGTPASGTVHSLDDGVTFTAITTPTLLGATEDSTGTLWATGMNYTADHMGIGTAKDLTAWTTLLRFQDIAAPVDCQVETVQHDTCAPLFCGLHSQYDIGPASDCPPVMIPAPDMTPPGVAAGCCNAGGGSGSILLGVVVIILRRRRS